MAVGAFREASRQPNPCRVSLANERLLRRVSGLFVTLQRLAACGLSCTSPGGEANLEHFRSSSSRWAHTAEVMLSLQFSESTTNNKELCRLHGRDEACHYIACLSARGMFPNGGVPEFGVQLTFGSGLEVLESVLVRKLQGTARPTVLHPFR